MVPDKNYIIGDSAHEEIVALRLEKFETQLQRLRSQDWYIIAGSMVAMGTFLGTWVFPLTTIACIGTSCATTAWTKDRLQMAREYNQALVEAIEVYKWAMKDNADIANKVRNPALQKLVFSLGPYLSNETLVTWRDSDLGNKSETAPAPTDSFLSRGFSYMARATGLAGETKLAVAVRDQFETLAKPEKTATWDYRLYGETGGEDLLLSLKSHIPKPLQSLSSTVFSMKQ